MEGEKCQIDVAGNTIGQLQDDGDEIETRKRCIDIEALSHFSVYVGEGTPQPLCFFDPM